MITHPYEHLKNHQSAIYVYESHLVAHMNMIIFAKHNPPSGTDILWHRQSFVRSDPDFRVPCAILFVGVNSSPHSYQGMSAIVEIPIPLPHSSNYRWQWLEFQKTQERFRRASD